MTEIRLDSSVITYKFKMFSITSSSEKFYIFQIFFPTGYSYFISISCEWSDFCAWRTYINTFYRDYLSYK